VSFEETLGREILLMPPYPLSKKMLFLIVFPLLFGCALSYDDLAKKLEFKDYQRRQSVSSVQLQCKERSIKSGI
jgi:hypothetical protein